MHDQLFKRRAGTEKLFANPPKIGRPLLRKRHAGADTRVHEHIIACHDHVLAGFQERTMGCRNGVNQQAMQLVIIGPGVGLRADAVAQDRLFPADPAEQAQRLCIARKRTEEDLFVVAQQEAHVRPRVPQCDKTVDHLGGLRPAIDQVAQEDQLARRSAARRLVLHNLLQQPVEQIESTMDVTNGVQPATLRNPGGRGRFLASKEEFREHSDCTTHFAMNREWRQMGRRGRRASLGRAIGAALAAWLVAAPAPAADPVFPAIRATDSRLAAIGYRLATANAPLCDQQEPGLGLLLHTPEQYSRDLRAAAVRFFHLDGPVGVEAVIQGSPAAQAGIVADDALLGIGTVRFAAADLEGEATTAAARRAAAQLAALPPAAPLEVHGLRNGAPYARTVRPVPACRSRFEVEFGTEWTAKADGEMVQIGSPFLETYPDDQLAAVVAHELAHNILRHRVRLEAKGVDYGMLSGFGRNVRYFRQTELEADILSVSLLANAGYDPQVAVRFWQDFGPKRAGGLLRSRSHPTWTDRVATIRHAIAGIGTDRPHRPALLATHGQPLSGDWQALLVKAP